MLRLLIVSLICATSMASAKEMVRISTGEWAPYISESVENNGLLVQIASESFAAKGLEMKLGFFPWVRATELSKSGEWDGTLAFARLKEREEFYLFSQPIYIGQYVLFHLKSRPLTWSSYGDLKRIVMASTRGFGGMGDEFLNAEKTGKIKVLRLTSDAQSFNMLKSGRVGAVPSDLEVGYALLRKLYGADAKLFTHSSHVIKHSSYHLVISKKNKNAKKIIEAFDEGLNSLRGSGRYVQILNEWYGRDIYKSAIPLQYLPTAGKQTRSEYP